jgi:1,4-alpha-glucan branching enzyme
MRAKFSAFVAKLGRVYLENPCFWRCDPDVDGYAWIDGGDAENSVISYRRRADGRETVVILNLTPVPRENYRVGAPLPGRWLRRFSSDEPHYGGSSFVTAAVLDTEPVPMHGLAQSFRLDLPPLGALILVPA